MAARMQAEPLLFGYSSFVRALPMRLRMSHWSNTVGERRVVPRGLSGAKKMSGASRVVDLILFFCRALKKCSFVLQHPEFLSPTHTCGVLLRATVWSRQVTSESSG